MSENNFGLEGGTGMKFDRILESIWGYQYA